MTQSDTKIIKQVGKKIAVVLLNLGGPDCKQSVRPYLFNFFRDRRIIPLPAPLRYLVALMISTLRHKKSSAEYAKMAPELGGGSPLLPNTILQQKALEKWLNSAKKPTNDTCEYRCFVAMRYWHPLTNQAVDEVQSWGADEVILLPLYPQFCTATTLSAFEEYFACLSKAMAKPSAGNGCCGNFQNCSQVCFPPQKSSKISEYCQRTRMIYTYHREEKFISAHVNLILSAIEKIDDKSNIEIIFSAHGIPQDLPNQGDPYQMQIEETVEDIMLRLRIQPGFENFSHKLCYQSRVGPKKWLTPYIQSVIPALAAAKKHLVVVPVAFVSEHLETLVELDHQYCELAMKCGASGYTRVPALGVHEDFIGCLAGLVWRKTSLTLA